MIGDWWPFAAFLAAALVFAGGGMLAWELRARRQRRPPAEPRLGAGTGKWFYISHQEVQVLAAALTDYLERTDQQLEARGIPPWRLVAELHRRVTLQATQLVGLGGNAVCRTCGDLIYRHRVGAPTYDGHPFRAQWWWTDEDLEAALAHQRDQDRGR